MVKLYLTLVAVLFTAFKLPEKPQVLIIGDSISIGYFPFVKDALKDKADVFHNAGNAEFTANGLKKINGWLGNKHWDVIQFNWGLWDIAYRNPAAKNQGNRDKINGKLTATPQQYQQNLEALVAILKKTGAKLIFVTTTMVPDKEAGRFVDDVEKYNAIAKKVMEKNGITVNDLYPVSVPCHKQFGLGDDNVHYSDKGYEVLSQQVVKGLKEVL